MKDLGIISFEEVAIFCFEKINLESLQPDEILMVDEFLYTFKTPGNERILFYNIYALNVEEEFYYQ